MGTKRFPIRRHISYAKYLLRHKWFVTVECFRHGLIWRGLVHDLSKFRPSEWFPYARYFYAPNGKSYQAAKRDKTGYYKPTDTGDAAFDFAWLLHQKRNRHHWQWWMLPEDDGGVKVIPMRLKYVKEMICDWKGAGRAQGVENWQDVRPWYEKNKGKIQLEEITRKLFVETLIEEWI